MFVQQVAKPREGLLLIPDRFWHQISFRRQRDLISRAVTRGVWPKRYVGVAGLGDYIHADFMFNPYTAAACKVSGLKDARTRPETVYFSVRYHIYFRCYHFYENPPHMRVRKKKKKRDLKVLNFALLLGVFK